MNVLNSTALQDEVVLVTGATGGIGSETARVLSDLDADLVLTGRREDALDKLNDDLQKNGSDTTIYTHAADITIPDDRRTLLKRSEEEVGSITGLVNGAGIGDNRVGFENLEDSDIEETIRVNYAATVKLTRAVYGRMIEHGHGAIVNVSSLSGLRGTYQHVPYTGSKFALTGFTQSLALEAIENDVRVNAVCPGWVDTEMGRDGIASKAQTNDISVEEQLSKELDAIPSGRITDPKEVANTIAFLLADAVPNIVGETVKLSGGSVLR